MGLVGAGALALALAAAFCPSVAGIPVEFGLFALTLIGVAVLHHYTLPVALTGLSTVALYKMIFTGFKAGTGLVGFALHMEHEWVMLTNLFCLLTGFAILSRHFEKSHVPVVLPKYLPDDWKGGFVLLCMVFVLSSFLDNIAAAMIGGTMAHQLFKGRVHIGYLAAIVAASNAGGAGSVVGDTTTTMMWIDGVSPFDVMHAAVAAVFALAFFGYFAAHQQHAYSPIIKNAHAHTRVQKRRLGIVGLILVMAIGTNVVVNMHYTELSSEFPFIGVAVWVAILATIPVRRHVWEVLPGTAKGSVFLLCLVSIASMMPVEALPPASWMSAFALGFISSVFDNIPLTALALKQGGFDWGILAYCVGFGGSMIWFGSSAGVALSNQFPQARSVGLWIRHGWHVIVAYVIGFAAVMILMGWEPHPPHRAEHIEAARAAAVAEAESAPMIDAQAAPQE